MSATNTDCAPTTCWDLVMISAGDDPDDDGTRAALAELCSIYWRPVFSFIRLHGYTTHDAQDLTQDFFAMILKTNWLQRADPGRGRFRCFLLKSIANFLRDAEGKKRTLKRGGMLRFISWEYWMAEEPKSAPPAPADWVEERFDAEWASGIVGRVMRQLERECGAKLCGVPFFILASCIMAPSRCSYAAVTYGLNVRASFLKKIVHRLRIRFGQLLRAELAKTVTTEAELLEELRHLLTVWGTISEFGEM